MDLYKREKISPFAGCFSSIIQLVIILSVFWLVSQPLTYMKKDLDPQVIQDYKVQLQQEGNQSTYSEIAIINRFGSEDERVRLNMDFLGLDLSKVPSNNLSDWTVYIIPLLYVISSVVSIKITNSFNKKKKNEKKAITDGTEVQNSGEPNELEAMEAMNKNMMYMLPLMSVFIAFIAPLGLALYWFVSNILVIIEKIIIDAIMKHKEEKENA